MSYEDTKVSVSSSQEGIRRLLLRHDAERFNFAEGRQGGRQWAGVEFVHAGHLVRMMVPLKLPTEAEIVERIQRARRRTPAQVRAEATDGEARRIWRVLHWSIKARLEAVEEGVETFEQAFLAHLVDPAANRTVWEMFEQPIADGMLRLGGGGMRALVAGANERRALPVENGA